MKNILILMLLVVFAVWILGSAEKCLFPLKYRESVIKYSAEFDLEPEFVFSVIKAESSFSKNAISSKNAVGLMQLMYDTAKSGAVELKIENFNEKKLLEPDTNIRLGCWHIRKLYDEYDSMFAIIAAYNAGGKNFRNWFENIDYKSLSYTEFEKNIKYSETRKFFIRVTNNYYKYKKIYGSKMEE